MDNLNIIDYLLIAVLVFSMIRGLSRGLIKEVIGLLTFIAAFIIAIVFSTRLAGTFTNTAGVQGVLSQASSAIGVNTAQPVSYVAIGISFALLFGATVIIGSILGLILNVFFQYGVLGLGNRLLGSVFGFCKGFILCAVIAFVVQLTPFVTSPLWQHSQIVASLQTTVEWIGGVVSPSLVNLKSRFGQTIQNVNSSIHNMAK
jgi:membrane protein required for colicin V production